ncbi:type II toxin-antitoxin system HigB family toxin [Laspinema olomoucense]|uniref:type II toxin-antitoxin system HigB family toxin n=1 Tax=Laspinema olomoucense TaxID=3231600 RepID=UPI0021BB11B9|nr:type II toxin-antitoxin system HigB family toxin [Laspinema sp. D3c]
MKNIAEHSNVFPSPEREQNFRFPSPFILSKPNRLIVYIDYEYRMVFIRSVLTHSEYSKENWKNDEWFKES